MRNSTLLLLPLFLLACANKPTSKLSITAEPVASKAGIQTASPVQQTVVTSSQNSEQASQVAELVRQIEKQNHNYQSKPRKAFVGARAKQTSVAMYMDDWRRQMEKVGTLNFPIDADGNKMYGQLRITLEIASDGHLLNAKIDKSSGNPELDKAALRMLVTSSPFKKLPTDMLDADGKPARILMFVRTWTFERQTTSID